MRVYSCKDGQIISKNYSPGDDLGDAIWIDADKMQKEERDAIEKRLGLTLHLHKNQFGICSDYSEADIVFFVASLLDGDNGLNKSDCSFMVTKHLLVTIRQEGSAFFDEIDAALLSKDNKPFTAHGLLILLLRHVVSTAGDLLRCADQAMDDMMFDIFAINKIVKKLNYTKIFKDIGVCGLVVSKVEESAHSLLVLINHIAQSGMCNQSNLNGLTILMRDLMSLEKQGHYVNGKTSFLLDTALGMVNLEQSFIIKVVSIASVVFLPPTLVASIYGMNFEFIPLLQLKMGYHIALFFIVLSAMLPYCFFKFKKWL